MDAMEENEEKIEAKFDKMMDSIDMLFNKMENIHFAQQQKQVKLDINTKAVDQSMRDQQVMAKHIDETGKVVARLTLDRGHGDRGFLSGDSGPASPHESQQFYSKSREGEENPFSRPQFGQRAKDPCGAVSKPALPKLHFPIFEGQDPIVWREKCETYFKIYDIPERIFFIF
jgi:hypothetical protein